MTVPAGWRAKLNYAQESEGYGLPNTNTTYNYPGAVSNATIIADNQPIIVYRMDGVTRDPAYLLEGLRNIELDLTYIPQNWNILQDMILNPQSISHTYAFYDTDNGNQYYVGGLIANTVQLSGTIGQGGTQGALQASIKYWGQQVYEGQPTGVVYAGDPGSSYTPFYFANESFNIDGTQRVEVLSFQVNVTNNLKRVPQFNSTVIRALPVLTGSLQGSITATFDDMSDYNNVTSYSPHTVDILLGNNNNTNWYIQYTGCKFSKITINNQIDDIVGITIPFDATGVNFHN